MNLQTLLEAIDQLPADELAQLRQHVEQQQMMRASLSDEDVEVHITAIHAALENFRAGFTDEELKVLAEAINVNYIYPMKDLGMYDWLDELPEDER